MPSDLHIPNSHKNQTNYPSKPTKPNVSSSHRPNKPQPIKMHSSRPTKPQEPLRESVEYNQISSRPRPCDGECVSGLFALLCDDVDTNAYCENEGSCCVTSDNSNVQPTSPRPVNFAENNALYIILIFHFFFVIDSTTKMSWPLHVEHFARIMYGRSCAKHSKL